MKGSAKPSTVPISSLVPVAARHGWTAEVILRSLNVEYALLTTVACNCDSTEQCVPACLPTYDLSITTNLHRDASST